MCSLTEERSLIFFFSSRRRHTRFDCDWSSDVCSSDLLDHWPPLILHGLRDLGVAVARQVHEQELLRRALGSTACQRYTEEGQEAGPARRLAHPRQVLAPQEGVQQRGLADIGAPGEGDLGKVSGGELRGLCRPGDQLRGE